VNASHLLKGRLVGGAKPNVPLRAGIEFTHETSTFNGVRECFAFQNFCAVGEKIITQKGRQWVSAYLSVSFVFHTKFNIPFSLSICCVVVFSPLVPNVAHMFCWGTTERFTIKVHQALIVTKPLQLLLQPQ